MGIENECDIIDGIEECDKVSESGDEAGSDLDHYPFWHILLWLRDLLGHMGLAVGSANRESGVNESKDEAEAVVIPSREVGVLFPDEGITSMSASGHDGQDQDSDE